MGARANSNQKGDTQTVNNATTKWRTAKTTCMYINHVRSEKTKLHEPDQIKFDNILYPSVLFSEQYR